MPMYQVVLNRVTRAVAIQNEGDTPPVGSIVAGVFEDANGPFKPDISWVLYHRVRDALYKQGVLDMQSIRIYEGALPFAVSGPSVLSRTEGTAFTQQYSIVSGTGPFTWAVVPTTAGFSINSSGLLSVADSVADGTYNITVRATDSTAAVANHVVAVTILDASVPVTVPGVPRNLTATASDGQVSATWLAPLSDGGAPIDDYRLRWNGGTAVELGDADLNGSVPATNGTPGTLEVAAHNSVGWGDWSTASNSVTPEEALVIMAFNRLSSHGQQTTNTDNYTHFNDRHSIGNRSGVPVNKIVLRFSNTTASGASLNNGSQPVTISVGIGPETSSQSTGTLTRALFPGGANTHTLAPGESIDTLPVTLAADIAVGAAMLVQVHSSYTVAPAFLNTSGIPSSRPTVDVNEGGIGLSNKAGGGVIAGRYKNRHINAPIAVFATPVGTPNGKSIAVFGDSIAAGANDGTTGTGMTGFIQRALTALVPFTTAAQPGFSWNAAGFAPGPSDDFLRKAQILKNDAFSHALICLGGNDVKDGVTAASIQTRMLNAKAWFLARGIKMIPMTGLPRTNSTNTAANTTDNAGAMEQYLLMNDNIRNNVGGVSEFGYFDRHAALADPGNASRWRTDLGGNVYDTDGIHLTTLGHTTLTTALTEAVPTLFV